MTIFGHTLGEVQKALIAAIGFVGFALLFLIQSNFDPGLIPAIETLVPTGFAVITVFAANKFSEQDFSKALLGFISAGVGVYNYFGEVDPETEATLAILAGYAATFLGVFLRRNDEPIALEPLEEMPAPRAPPATLEREQTAPPPPPIEPPSPVEPLPPPQQPPPVQ